MQCKCGGATVTKIQPKVRNKVRIAVAELDVCEACGRNGGPVRIWLTNQYGEKTKRIDDETLKRLTARKTNKANARKRRAK